MGKVIAPLSERKLPKQTIFGDRFVVECCETFHFHFRNLRFELTHDDFLRVAESLQQMAAAYVEHGAPASHPHLELGRARLENADGDGTLSIELCENLYKKWPTGWDSRFHREDSFVHIHWRDLRLEMSNAEFLEVAAAFGEAAKSLRAWKLKTLPEIFSLLDEEGIIWAVLRNWKNLPHDVTVGPHSDLDLIVHPDHVARFDQILDCVRTSDDFDRVQRRVDVMTADGPSYVLVDVRSPGDGYHPDWLSHRMLSRRVRHRGFWVLHPEDHYLGIAYHMCAHKGITTFDYLDTMRRLSRHTVFSAPPFDDGLSFAANTLGAAGIQAVRPVDRSVVPLFPVPEEGERVISSRYLGTVDEKNVFSRVSRCRSVIRKRTAGDFLRHEYDILGDVQDLAVPTPTAFEEEAFTCRMDMRPIDGEPLSACEDRIRAWSFDDAKLFVTSLVGIVAALAERGIEHRDIRADNILVSGNEPSLIDFGWATSKRRPLPEPVGDLLGGEARAPEGGPCDAYSLGYVIETAIEPFFPEFETLSDTLMHLRNGDEVDWKEMVEFASLIEKDEEEDPTSRFVTLCELGRYAEAEGILDETSDENAECAFWRTHLGHASADEVETPPAVRGDGALAARVLAEAPGLAPYVVSVLRHHVEAPPKPHTELLDWVVENYEAAVGVVELDALRHAFVRGERIIDWVRLQARVESAEGSTESRDRFLSWVERTDPMLDLESAALIAELCAEEGRTRWAVDVATHVIDNDPYDVGCRRVLARDASRRSLASQALDHWRQIMTLDPSDEEARAEAARLTHALATGKETEPVGTQPVPDDPVGILDFVRAAIAEARLDDAARGIRKLQGQFSEYRDAADVALARLAEKSQSPDAPPIRVVVDPLSEATYEEDLSTKRVQLAALVQTPLGDHPEIRAVWEELRDIIPPSIIEVDATGGPLKRTG